MFQLWMSLSSPPLFLDTPDSPSPGVGPAPCLTLCQSLDITHLAQDQWGSEWEGDTQGSSRGSLPPDLGQILCQVREQQGHGVRTSLPSWTPWSMSQPLIWSRLQISSVHLSTFWVFQTQAPQFSPTQSGLLFPRVSVPCLGHDHSHPSPRQVPGCLC